MKKLALVATAGVLTVGGVLISTAVASKVKKAKEEQESLLDSIHETMEELEAEETVDETQEAVQEEVQQSEVVIEVQEEVAVVEAVQEVEKEEVHELLDMSKKVEDISRELRNIYPIEGTYGSARTLWVKALENGEVTKEKYEEAEQYYGTRWHYTGD